MTDSTDTRLNLVSEFDNLMLMLPENSLAEEFLKYVKHQQTVLQNNEELKAECKRLNERVRRLEKVDNERNALATERAAIASERNALASERNALASERNALASERNALPSVLAEVRQMLDKDPRCKIPEVASNKPEVIIPNNDHEETLDHYNSHTNLELTDMSITRSEDNYDESSDSSSEGSFSTTKRKSKKRDKKPWPSPVKQIFANEFYNELKNKSTIRGTKLRWVRNKISKKYPTFQPSTPNVRTFVTSSFRKNKSFGKYMKRAKRALEY